MAAGRRGTTQGGIKQCQVSVLPQAEHNKMYVWDGTIFLCKATIALQDLHNDVHITGGFAVVRHA